MNRPRQVMYLRHVPSAKGLYARKRQCGAGFDWWRELFTGPDYRRWVEDCKSYRKWRKQNDGT